jgi:hypothetical protein
MPLFLSLSIRFVAIWMSLLLNETDRDLKSPYALTAGGLAHAFEPRATTTEQP